jgi:hypothetical protein
MVEPNTKYVPLGELLKNGGKFKILFTISSFYTHDSLSNVQPMDFLTTKKPKQNVSSNCARSRGLVPVHYF